MRSLSDLRVRAFYVSCLILVPFLKFLIRNDYGFFYFEALAAVLLLAAVCGLLGLAVRGGGFHILIALLIAVTATYPLLHMANSPSAIPPWTVGLAILAVSWLALRWMGEGFLIALAVFAWSGLPVEAVMQPKWTRAATLPSTAKAQGHALWLIFDEQVGLAGYPLDLPECSVAKLRLQHTLERYNFTLFPNAYSNYPTTVDSVPSVLNGRLVRWPEELMPRVGASEQRHYEIRENHLFSEFTAKGYSVAAWQFGAVKICPGQNHGVECFEYRERLSWLHRIPGGWVERFRWLVGSYQASDPWTSRTKGFFPFRFGIKLALPLAVEELWPDGLAAQVQAAPQRTLLAAHLLIPHSPYIYHRDGRLRPKQEWAGDRAGRRFSERDYREMYCRYCEQTEYVAVRLDRFLHRLKQSGVLEGMNIVIHGDHGPRILRRLPNSVEPELRGRDEAVWAEILDYSGEPDRRDLMDRFSTLLAIKRAGATAPLIRQEKHSLLTFLSREMFGKEPQDGLERADKVYMADSQHALHAIDIQYYWR